MTAISRPFPGPVTGSATALRAPYRNIHPVHALFLRLLGPADCWDSPLIGTKYDPYYQTLRHRQQVQRRRERALRRSRSAR